METLDMENATVVPEINNYIKGVTEALLFVSDKPISLDQIKDILETVSVVEIKQGIADLIKEYEEKKSGVIIAEIAEGYQMLSNPLYVNYVREFFKTKHKEKLSKPALETLAIIAYKQPVTRTDVELVRGVNSDGVVAHLLNKELIKVVGRKEIPGRPFMYGTTKQFLEYFGLKSLDTLPSLEELEVLASKAADESSVSEEISDEGIPTEVVAMNTMERQKLRAIHEAEANYLKTRSQELPLTQEIQMAEEVTISVTEDNITNTKEEASS